MSFNLTSSGACVWKGGKKISPDVSGAMLSKFCDMAEASLCAITRRDWITLSGATKENFRGILDDTVSSMVAMDMINYDMSGFTSRLEASTCLDVLKDRISTNLACLKDDSKKEVMVNSGT